MGKLLDWFIRDNTDFVKGKSNEKKADEYAGKVGDHKHCHLWVDKNTGSTGVVHRGSCKVCDDRNASGSKK